MADGLLPLITSLLGAGANVAGSLTGRAPNAGQSLLGLSQSLQEQELAKQKLAQEQAKIAAETNQRQTFFAASKPEFEKYKYNPAEQQMISTLPIDDQQKLLNFKSQQEQNATSLGFRSRAETRAENAAKLSEKHYTLAAQRLGFDITDKTQRKTADKEAGAIFEKLIPNLPPNEQLRAKALLKSGNIVQLNSLFKPEKPKPGSIQGLFAAIEAGQVTPTDPESIRNYYGSTLPKIRADAATAQFLKQYTEDPSFVEKTGQFLGLISPKRALNPAGAAAIANQAPIPEEKQKPSEIERFDSKSGKTAIFNVDTKEFIRWK